MGRARARRWRKSGGAGGLPPQFLKAIQALAMVCARSAVEHVALDQEADVALEQFAQMESPLPDLASFLRRVAAGELPSVPPVLPAEIREFLMQLLQAIKDSH